MQVSVRWQSQTGSRAQGNRDCAGLGIADDSVLVAVADGATAGGQSGELAKILIHGLVDWFVSTNGAAGELELTRELQRIQGALPRDFHHCSASYLLAIAGPGRSCLVAYAGDCILGTVSESGSITWLTAPNTLANALVSIPVEELAKDRSRHLLTRSFRHREFMRPARQTFDIGTAPLLLATDGFWAELSAEDQLAFLSGRRPCSRDEHDDRGVLELSCSDLAKTVIDAVEVVGDMYSQRRA